MGTDGLLTFVRVHIGEPSLDDVTDRSLLDLIWKAMEWLASELEYSVVTDSFAFALEGDQYQYPFPPDMATLLWVEYNDRRLTPSSVAKWARDGTHWRTAESSVPGEYAVMNRSLILYHPPSDDAVEDAPFLTAAYISTAPELGPGGTALLIDADLVCAGHVAAIEWLGLHPGGTAELTAQRQAQLASNKEMLSMLLPQAKRRAERPIKSYTKHFRLKSYRRGAAR